MVMNIVRVTFGTTIYFKTIGYAPKPQL